MFKPGIIQYSGLTTVTGATITQNTEKSGSRFGGSSTANVIQTLTLLGTNVKITTVNAKVARTSTVPSDSLMAYVIRKSTGTIIDTSTNTIAGNTLTTSPQFKAFTFAGNYYSNSDIAFALGRTGSLNNSVGYSIGDSYPSSLYSGGSGYYGSLTSNVDLGHDFTFNIVYDYQI